MRRAWQALSSLVRTIVEWKYFKPLVFLLCLLPLVEMAHSFWLVWTGRDPMALGTDPTKSLLHQSGETALAILLLTLTVTPVRRIFSVNRVQIVRRMLGVWSFAYALVHLSIYLVFDQLCYSPSTCQFEAVWQDILKRRFIFVGQLAFVCLLLLAITSTSGWVRRLKKNWVRLHRLAYLAATAGIVHFIWIQKSDISVPLRWAAWLAVVLGFRVIWGIAKSRSRA